MSEEGHVFDEKKRLPSDDVTRDWLIDLMHTLPGEMAEAAKDARADAVRAQRDLKFAQASLESVANHLDDWQDSIRALCRIIQNLLMVESVWNITQSDDDSS